LMVGSQVDESADLIRVKSAPGACADAALNQEIAECDQGAARPRRVPEDGLMEDASAARIRLTRIG
jgi:hypothetical protein